LIIINTLKSSNLTQNKNILNLNPKSLFIVKVFLSINSLTFLSVSIIFYFNFKIIYYYVLCHKLGLRVGDWGLGIGPIPNPQSP